MEVEAHTRMYVAPSRGPIVKGMTWSSYLIVEGQSGTTMADSVASLAEAEDRADRLGYELSIDLDARTEMVKAGVAPSAASGGQWQPRRLA